MTELVVFPIVTVFVAFTSVMSLKKFMVLSPRLAFIMKSSPISTRKKPAEMALRIPSLCLCENPCELK